MASLTIKDITIRRPPPQKLLFSATLSNDPELLKELGLFQPRLFTSVVSGSSSGIILTMHKNRIMIFLLYPTVETNSFLILCFFFLAEQSKISSFVGKFTTPAELTEQWVSCDLETKPLYLYHLISEGDWNTVIVFANSVETVHRLAVLMKHLFKDSRSVAEVSSALNRAQRSKMLKKLGSGAVNV